MNGLYGWESWGQVRIELRRSQQDGGDGGKAMEKRARTDLELENAIKKQCDMRRDNASKEKDVVPIKMNVLFNKVWDAEFSNGKIASLDVKTRMQFWSYRNITYEELQ